MRRVGLLVAVLHGPPRAGDIDFAAATLEHAQTKGIAVDVIALGVFAAHGVFGPALCGAQFAQHHRQRCAVVRHHRAHGGGGLVAHQGHQAAIEQAETLCQQQLALLPLPPGRSCRCARPTPCRRPAQCRCRPDAATACSQTGRRRPPAPARRRRRHRAACPCSSPRRCGGPGGWKNRSSACEMAPWRAGRHRAVGFEVVFAGSCPVASSRLSISPSTLLCQVSR